MTKVLIVEDDELLGRGMAEALTENGFDPILVTKGDVALARLRYGAPDVCVLDLMLPGLDGWRPIVVASARGSEHDRIHALEIGADDYLVKPVSMKELVARVRAAARRGHSALPRQDGESLELEELRIDPRDVQAYVDGVSAELTPTEFKLLYALALDAGRVVTRDELLQKIWGRRRSFRDRTVDVCVKRLRDKIDRRASRHTFIQTRFGVGYKLDPIAKDSVAELSELERGNGDAPES
jgi:DNA-binding response OmpR family regulator